MNATTGTERTIHKTVLNGALKLLPMLRLSHNYLPSSSALGFSLYPRQSEDRRPKKTLQVSNAARSNFQGCFLISSDRRHDSRG